MRSSKIKIDADRISPHLYQGSRPPVGRALSDQGFDLVVLSAQEYQPHAQMFDGVSVAHVPLDDHLDPLSPEELLLICRAARLVARSISLGHRVLVTCFAGVNRSGMISAVALSLAAGISPAEAIQVVKKNRPGALRNSSFVAQIPYIVTRCKGSRMLA